MRTSDNQRKVMIGCSQNLSGGSQAYGARRTAFPFSQQTTWNEERNVRATVGLHLIMSNIVCCIQTIFW
jgi:hypothetical protein